MSSPLLTRRQVAEFLHVSLDAIDKFLRQDDPPPHLRAGRRLLFQPERVLAWAERQAKRHPVAGGHGARARWR